MINNNNITFSVNINGKFTVLDLTDEQKDKIKCILSNITKFKPKVGETYWYVYKNKENNYIVDGVANFSDTYIPDLIRVQQPCFRTSFEAENYRLYLKKLDEYSFVPNWEDKQQEKIYLYFSHSNKKICMLSSRILQYPNVPVFSSMDIAYKFIDEVGEDNVKKFIFDIWN